MAAPNGCSSIWTGDGMTRLYTKNGRPLQIDGARVYSKSGTYVGRIDRGKVFDPRGRYAGTIVGERVVFRGSDSAAISGPSVAANQAGCGAANRGGSGLWGDEPAFPD